MKTTGALPFVGIIIGMILAGCQLLPQKKTQSESFKGAEALAGTNSLLFRKVVEGEKAQPLPNLTVSGTSNTVTVSTSPVAFGAAAQLGRQPYRETIDISSAVAQTVSSKQEGQSKYSVSLPLGVGLLLSALGICAVTFAIRYALKAAKNGSSAASAALDAADTAMANRIRTWKAKAEALQAQAAATTDAAQITDAHRQIAALQTEIAAHEAERGKLLAKAP